MKRLNFIPVSLLILAGCASNTLPAIALLPTWPYEQTAAPIVTQPKDQVTNDDLIRVVIDYVHQTRHWADEDFEIHRYGPQRDGIFLFGITYLPDQPPPQAKLRYTGESRNSFGILVDPEGRVLRETHFE